MVHKGKRATITRKGLRHIIKRSLDSPRLQRTKLAEKIQDELKAMGEDIPEVEVLERKISYWRKHEPDLPIDKPWSMASLVEYPIPADALPMVMEICLRRVPEGDPDEYFTIREALWVARLYKLIEVYKPRNPLPDVYDAVFAKVLEEYRQGRPMPTGADGKELNTTEDLALAWGIKSELEVPVEALVDDWASAFAGYEQLSEIEGEPFDSQGLGLDTHIVSNVYEYWGERRGSEIEGICADYGLDRSDFYKLLTLNLPISEIEEIVKSGKYKKEAQNERSHSQEVQE